jgi:hypothetical protein
MKKIALAAGIISLMVFSACVSTPVDTSPIDRGTHPADFSAAQAVTLYIQGNVGVFGVDNDESVLWENTDQREQFVNLGSGLHVFQVKYNDGKLQSKRQVSLAARLEDGRSYLLKAITDEDNVSFTIVQYIDGQEGEEATLYLGK